MTGVPLHLEMALPDWVAQHLAQTAQPVDDAGRMALTIELARQNVLHRTGGPFGAAVFSEVDGQLVAVGVNCVEQSRNSVLHAEVMALMLAERRLDHFSLKGGPAGAYALFTSCEPCAMCLGAILWSGIQRVVCAATKQDAATLGFDEGPVSAESYQYLEHRGTRIKRGLMADAARQVMIDYLNRGGLIYNG